MLIQSTIIEQDDSTSNSMHPSDSSVLAEGISDIAATPESFSINNDEPDLDSPTEGFSSISEAIEDIRQGKVCLNRIILFSDLPSSYSRSLNFMLNNQCWSTFVVCDCC